MVQNHMGPDQIPRPQRQDLASQLAAPDSFPGRISTIQIGEDLLATHPDGTLKNTSACLFLRQKGLIDHNFIVASRPNHAAGAIKMAFLMAYLHGEGMDIPQLGISKDKPPSEEQLGILQRIFMGEKINDVTRDTLEPVNTAANKYGELALKSYIPIVMRGFKDKKEICIRQDGETNIGQVEEAIRILSQDMGYPSSQIKVIASQPKISENLREYFEKKGELFRLYPPTGTKEAQTEFINHSAIKTTHGIKLYYAAGTGERLLTEESMRDIVDGYLTGSVDRQQLGRQLNDLLGKYGTRNRMGVSNLSLYMVDPSHFGIEDIREAHSTATEREGADYKHTDAKLKQVLSTMMQKYHDATAEGYHTDDVSDSEWRHKMYTRLMGLHEVQRPEEMKIGLSKEYVGEVRWLPGATVVPNPHFKGGWDLHYLPETGTHEKTIIQDFGDYCKRKGLKLEHINVGRVVESLSKREKQHPDELREVYVVEWKVQGDKSNRVDLLRRQKWDEQYYLLALEFDLGEKGIRLWGPHKQKVERDEGRLKYDDNGRPYLEREWGRLYARPLTRDEARNLTLEYQEFVLHRNKFEVALFPTHPEVQVTVPVKDRGPIVGDYETYFFIRSYVNGVAVDKIPETKLGNPEFTKKLVRLMGVEAAHNAIVGRINPLTGEHIYGDGDEIIQFNKPLTDDDSMPAGYIRPEETSVLGDVDSPMSRYTPGFARWITRLLQKAKAQGLSAKDLQEIAKEYSTAFHDEMVSVRKRVSEKPGIRNMFQYLSPTVGEERYQWPSCRYLVPKAIDRLMSTDINELTRNLQSHIQMPD
ncbi:MAG: hypothetical protein KKD39_07665 [Candidatus Altiarchaeota archaeon]|nr:hypothetical protein [Candidatus Altiarchaeota archaeon]